MNLYDFHIAKLLSKNHIHITGLLTTYQIYCQKQTSERQ